jgi:predicted nuclease of predicted toxin-antitoxin system
VAKIKLYLDEDISHTVAEVLRSRGYDVISAHEVGMRGKTDGEQLDHAIENKRLLITFNAKHFAPLVKKLYEEEREHFGIVVSNQINLSEMVKLIIEMLKVCKVDNLKNSLVWLQSFSTNINKIK